MAADRRRLGRKSSPLQVRLAAWWRRGGNWGRDLEFATRRLRRSPALVGAVVGTLTVGLGAFAVVYTAVQKILIDPMPYKQPDDLYFVWRDYRTFFDLDRGWLGGTDVAELQTAGGVIEEAAGMLRQDVTLAVREGQDTTQIAIIRTSPNLFRLLGVMPARGRAFAPQETGPGHAPLIILTHALWTRLGADENVLGTDVRLNGQPFSVIGVMPEDFAFRMHTSLGAPEAADAYVTLDVDLAKTDPGAGSYAGLLRARPGTPPQTVGAAVEAIGRRIDRRDFRGRGLKFYAVGLKPDLVARFKPALVVLGFAGTFLTLVLMVNLSSVLLARAATREREFAVSRALGADGLAIASATLVEGGLLGAMGGAAGALAARWGARALVAIAPLNLPRREAVSVTWDVAAVVVGLGLCLGLIAAIAPAIWAARSSLSSLLANTAVRGGGAHGHLRRGLVVVQVALSLVLLTAGGLVVRSFDRLLSADPGFEPRGLLVFDVPMPGQLIPNAKDAIALQDRISDGLAAIPGVAAVGAADALPLSGGGDQATVRIPGAPGNVGDVNRDRPLVDVIGARGGYVETMGMRVTLGRPFNRVREPGVREALIDTLLARQFFPTGSPLGARIPYNGNQLTVVGVVTQARQYGVHEDGRPQLFVRAEDWEYRTLSFAVRTAANPARLIADVRTVIRHVNPRLAVANARTMDEVVSASLRQQRTSAVLIAGFAVCALLLAAMGLFAIVSGSVARRRHELSLRLALGADHGRVLRLVLLDGAKLVGLGILIGAPGIYAAGGMLRGVLVGVSPSDPLTLLAVAGGLGLVAIAACYLPARRVLAIQPAESLRQE